MGAAQFTIDASLQDLLSTKQIGPGDLRELTALVQGDSVVDWTQLFFRSLPQVNEFLRVAAYDPDNGLDMERLAEIHREAVRYIRSTLSIEVPPVLAHPHRLQNVFMYASSKNRFRRQACMLLKVMHVINHLEARELLYHLPTSEHELFQRIDRRVSRVVSDMFQLGFPIEEYLPSRKTKESLITKLLSKRKSTAAQVFDRIRFRIITRTRADILPILFYLKRHLVPFTLVVPGESTNTLESVHDLIGHGFGVDNFESPDPRHRPAFNRFSHRDFRVISFVCDVPLRVEDLIRRAEVPLLTRFGHVVLIPTEFQIFDRETYEANETGPASHALYKERQIREVVRRLYTGVHEGLDED